MGQEYLDFQIKKFSEAANRFSLKIGGLLALGISGIIALPIYYSAGFWVLLAICGISSLVIIYCSWFLGFMATMNSMEFLRQLGHEEAERIRSS